MPQPTPPRPALRLTRRGRLVRSGLVLLLALLLVLAVIAIVRTFGAAGAPEGAVALSPASDAGSPTASGAVGADAAEEPSPFPTETGEDEAYADEDAEEGAEEEGAELVRSGTVGDGTWTLAVPAAAPAEAEGAVRTYAVRVEDGLGIDAEDTAAQIAAVLADPRGWQEIEDVTFQQVATLEEAELTISLGSPPTVDELCLPARTGGLWSCRVGPDVVLNSDRWLHATPTYDDLGEYRAYMINHEVGHFLGHDHAPCGSAGDPSPVMLQQSIDLQGCVPNAWPAEESSR